jgi:1,2-phenylacetyl-CoA epoxidase catalytic subunit
MPTAKTYIPKTFHDAVIKWRETFLPDYGFLMDNWEKHFPKEPRFEACAFREMGICAEIECGELKGKPKFTRAKDLHPSQAAHLLGAIKAQASTEFGSIQQHRLTLARAQDEKDQVWVLRMMAEELRHGYQMLHLLLEDDWSGVSDASGGDMVEEILSMTTGSHVLGAFNIEFDSFVDNATFCALIDRVGKYQLEMQRISAYKPFAESMPPMLREEAFHLAAGVVPMRRWMEQAAQGSVLITSEDIQKVVNKWLPRGLEMFGDERGGGTNVRYGLKPMKNAEAQDLYYVEIQKLVRDLNMRFVRARLPELKLKEAEQVLDQILADRGTVRGISWEELVHAPHKNFFRRRGLPAFELTGWDGETFQDVESYLLHLKRHLPDAYRASSDFRDYVDQLSKIEAGELTAEEAAHQMPTLRRVGGACPCSKSVRWVADNGVADLGAAS